MGLADPRPVTSSTLFNCFSCTKAVTALALHKLVDASDSVTYNDRVSAHWSDFGAAGKEDVTIEHVLTHSAGLERVGLETTATMSELCNWEHMLAKVARAVPLSPAGEVSKYHFLSFGWIVGGIVRALTGGRHLRCVCGSAHSPACIFLALLLTPPPPPPHTHTANTTTTTIITHNDHTAICSDFPA
jgi:CubicO group peptidase (beta-lactamase class C family)